MHAWRPEYARPVAGATAISTMKPEGCATRHFVSNATKREVNMGRTTDRCSRFRGLTKTHCHGAWRAAGGLPSSESRNGLSSPADRGRRSLLQLHARCSWPFFHCSRAHQAPVATAVGAAPRTVLTPRRSGSRRTRGVTAALSSCPAQSRVIGRSTSEELELSETRKYRKFAAQQKTEIVLASLREPGR